MKKLLLIVITLLCFTTAFSQVERPSEGGTTVVGGGGSSVWEVLGDDATLDYNGIVNGNFDINGGTQKTYQLQVTTAETTTFIRSNSLLTSSIFVDDIMEVHGGPADGESTTVTAVTWHAFPDNYTQIDFSPALSVAPTGYDSLNFLGPAPGALTVDTVNASYVDATFGSFTDAVISNDLSLSGTLELTDDFTVDGIGIDASGGNMRFFINDPLTPKFYVDPLGNLHIVGNLETEDTLKAVVLTVGQLGLGPYAVNVNGIAGMDTLVLNGDTILSIGSGGSYWNLLHAQLREDTSLVDTVRVMSVMEYGDPGNITGVTRYHHYLSSGYSYTVSNNFSRHTIGTNTLVLGGAGIVYDNTGQGIDDVVFRPVWGTPTGVSGGQDSLGFKARDVLSMSIDSNKVVAYKPIMLKASDTTTAILGAMVFIPADSSFYGCRSLVANKKWYKLN